MGDERDDVGVGSSLSYLGKIILLRLQAFVQLEGPDPGLDAPERES